MKKNLYSFGKCIAIMLVSLYSINSFSQSNPASFSNRNDTIGKKKPKLVKKNIICFGFFSPLNQHLSFEYDRLLGENIVLSSQVGIIGPGVDQSTNNTAGGFIEVGPKLFFSPDYVMDGMHRYNAMQGGYFKPQIIISVFNNTNANYSSNYYPYYYSTPTTTYLGVALMLNIGKQWVIARSVVLDMYVGLGYNLTNSTNSNEPSVDNYYSYLTFGSSFPLAIAGGVNIGLPF